MIHQPALNQKAIGAAIAVCFAQAISCTPTYTQVTTGQNVTAVPNANQEVTQITVTGSRIASADFLTPSPATSFSVTDLQASAPGTLADALRPLPSVVPGGGDYRVSTGQEIVRPLERKVILAHTDFEIKDSQV